MEESWVVPIPVVRRRCSSAIEALDSVGVDMLLGSDVLVGQSVSRTDVAGWRNHKDGVVTNLESLHNSTTVVRENRCALPRSVAQDR